MARRRSRILDWVTYVAIRLAAMLLRIFPIDALYRVADVLAGLMYRLDHRHRDRALGHLRRSFPDWPQHRVEETARASMRSLIYLGLEFVFITHLLTPARWRRCIRLHNMAETLRLLLEPEGGLVLVTGHFGNFEVLAYAMATLGFPNLAIARALDNPHLNEYVLALREKTGLHIVDKNDPSAAGQVERALETGRAVGFVADQDAGRKGVFVDFFGRPASTFKSVGLMAMQYQTPIVVAYARRLEKGFRFEIGAERIIRPAEWADQDDPLRWITQMYTAALEQIVRRDPGQYLWVHRRWKHRPRGEAAPASGIA